MSGILVDFVRVLVSDTLEGALATFAHINAGFVCITARRVLNLESVGGATWDEVFVHHGNPVLSFPNRCRAGHGDIFDCGVSLVLQGEPLLDDFAIDGGVNCNGQRQILQENQLGGNSSLSVGESHCFHSLYARGSSISSLC